jgi:hypothetical protein
VRLASGSISYAGTRIVVRYRFRLATYTLLFGSLPVLDVLRSGNYGELEFVAVLVLVGMFIDRVAVRLTADARGLRIVNYGVVRSFSWSDVESVRLVPLRWPRSGYRLEVTTRSGRRTRAIVASSSRTSGYRFEELEELVQHLDLLRKAALGVEPSAEPRGKPTSAAEPAAVPSSAT